MNSSEHDQATDWRARLHSLPSDGETAPPVVGWFLRAFLCLGLFVAGTVFVLISGAFVGLSRGLGPEQTGGTFYVLLGIVLNLIAGAGIAALVARRTGSRRRSRLVFYSFTAPAFLAVVLLAFLLVGHFFH